MKIIYFVTDSNIVKWHLKNYLDTLSSSFEMVVVGNNVLQFSNIYRNVKFINLDIKRKPSLLSDLHILIEFFIILRKERPDILHTIMPKSGLIGAIAGYLARVPFRMHTFTGQIWAFFVGFKKYFYIMVDRLIVMLNTQVLTDSKSQSAFLYSSGIRFENKPIPFLGSGSFAGVDLVRFGPTSLKPIGDTLNLKNKFVIAFVARKTKDKGALDVLKAFKEVNSNFPDTVLLYIGPFEDPDIHNDFNINYSNNPSIFCYEAVDNHEHFLLQADILCLPSKREGFGSIVIEAASSGCPCVGYLIPGMVDSVENYKTGILVEKDNISDLVSAIELLITNHDVYGYLSENAKRRTVEKFDKYIISHELSKIYNREQITKNS